MLVGFLDGLGKVPIVTGWNSGTPARVTLEADRIELGENATLGIARRTDPVDCFTVSAAPGPVPNTVVITITPAVGAPIVIALAGSGLSVTTASGAVTGAIADASAKSFAE